MSAALSLDPFDPKQTHDIWRIGSRFQREAPVARIGGGFWLVSRYDDVRHVLTRHDIFANAGGFRPTGLEVPLEDCTLGELDPPEHGPLRRLAMGAANGAGVVESLRPFTKALCRSLLQSLIAKGGGDVVGELSVPLTNQVIAKLLGVPSDRSGWLAEQAEMIMMSELPVTNQTMRGVGYRGAFPEFTAFVDELIRDRAGAQIGKDDPIVRIMVAAEGGTIPSDTIIRMILIQLLLGGSATTRDFIGSLFFRLITEPALLESIHADRALMPAAVEEGLRLAPPVLFLIRTCKVPALLAGSQIAPGERVIAAVALANRDETVFPSPDEFRLDRVRPAPHLSFGFGSHACVGNALARMEISCALESLLELTVPGDLRLADGYALRLMPTPFLYGPVSVDVIFKP